MTCQNVSLEHTELLTVNRCAIHFTAGFTFVAVSFSNLVSLLVSYNTMAYNSNFMSNSSVYCRTCFMNDVEMWFQISTLFVLGLEKKWRRFHNKVWIIEIFSLSYCNSILHFKYTGFVGVLLIRWFGLMFASREQRLKHMPLNTRFKAKALHKKFLWKNTQPKEKNAWKNTESSVWVEELCADSK